MSPQPLEARVDRLEKRVTSLERLPGQVEALTVEFLQFRTEVRGEFSAVRAEMHEQGETLRAEMRQMGETLRGEMRDLGDTLRGEMRDLGDTLRGEMRDLGTALRSEMQALGESLVTRILVLHEDVISRIATIAEAGRTASRRRSLGRSDPRDLRLCAYFFTFHGLNALSSASPSIANATAGKCREMIAFIEFSSTQSIPCLV